MAKARIFFETLSSRRHETSSRTRASFGQSRNAKASVPCPERGGDTTRDLGRNPQQSPALAIMASLRRALLSPHAMGWKPRDDERAERRSKRLLPTPAEDLHGLRIPRGDRAVHVHADDGVERRVDDDAQRRSSLARRVSSACLRSVMSWI